MRAFAGIDLGSTTAKTVIIDETGGILASEVIQMGAVSRTGMTRSQSIALASAGLDESDLVQTIATGYGRHLIPGVGRTFTEITCHARGVSAMCPETRLVVDIGGQDSKAILIDEWGLAEQFAMNDRCASGTGRFFEVLARALECDIGELAELALRGEKDLEVSSMCATFAETELISLLAHGEEREDIAASVHRAVAARTMGLVTQVGNHKPVVMTGGVARNDAAVHFLGEALGASITVPSAPQITGAYGAAQLALESALGANSEQDRGEQEERSTTRESRASCESCAGPSPNESLVAGAPSDHPVIPLHTV